jgi:hypothetical protein
MDDQVTSALAQSSAVRAFDELQGEVSLLRRAIEGLAAERRDQPDYGPTLEALATSNGELGKWARKVSALPALQLTPRDIGEQIEAAASQFRKQDRQELAAEHARLGKVTAELEAISRKAHTSLEQVRREKIIGGTFFLCGLVLSPILSEFASLSG